MTTEHKDYMGIIAINHRVDAQPVECAGSSIVSPAITEIAVYRAAMDMTTREAVKREMIAKIRMTDAQFGTLIARPNFNDGELCTLEMLEGFQVEEYHREDDYTSSDIKRAVHRAISGDNQINRFLDECKSLTEEAVSSGRFPAALKKSLIHNLNLLHNLKGNERAALEEVTELANKRVNDTHATIKQLMRHVNRKVKEQFALSAPDNQRSARKISPYAMLGISVGGGSSFELFNDVNTHGSTVSFTLKSAELREDTFDTDRNESSYRACGELFRLSISPQLYSLFLRSEQGEFPCTLTRFAGKGTDIVEYHHTARVDAQVEIKTPRNVDDFLTQADSLAERIGKGEFKGKPGLRLLDAEVSALRECYTAYLNGKRDTHIDNISSILQEHQALLSRKIDTEVAALPDAIRDEARAITAPLKLSLPSKE